jgi:hypothetical protein
VACSLAYVRGYSFAVKVQFSGSEGKSPGERVERVHAGLDTVWLHSGVKVMGIVELMLIEVVSKSMREGYVGIFNRRGRGQVGPITDAGLAPLSVVYDVKP